MLREKRWPILKHGELEFGQEFERNRFHDRNNFSECYFKPEKDTQVIIRVRVAA